ncbi:MAG: OmpH family outer membrane protein [Cyclobacteriaceae bacterium]
MKQLPLALSILSFIGVLALFGLYYSDKQAEEAAKEETAALEDLASHQLSFPVAFVEMEYVLQNYKLVHKIQKELLSQQKSAEARFNSKMKKHQRKAQEMQKDYEMLVKMQQNGSLTQQELQMQQQTFQNRQQALVQKEQELAQLQQQLQQQLSQNEMKLNTEMGINIQAFLKEFKEELNYSYVLVKGPGSSVWYGDTGLDISAKLVNVLNQKFDREQASKQ